MTASTDSQAAATRSSEVASAPGRSGTRLIDVLWTGSVLIAVASAVLTVLTWSDYKANDAISQAGSSVSTVAYATLGALIVRRVRNPIGWLLLTAGVSVGLMGLFSAYAVLGITTHPGAVPAPQQVGAVAEWLFFPGRGRAGLRVPPLPDRDLAVAALAPGRGAELPGHRAADDRLSSWSRDRWPCRHPAVHAHVPESVRRSGRRECSGRDSD